MSTTFRCANGHSVTFKFNVDGPLPMYNTCLTCGKQLVKVITYSPPPTPPDADQTGLASNLSADDLINRSLDRVIRDRKTTYTPSNEYLCEHANECPVVCPCSANCDCKKLSCVDATPQKWSGVRTGTIYAELVEDEDEARREKIVKDFVGGATMTSSDGTKQTFVANKDAVAAEVAHQGVGAVEREPIAMRLPCPGCGELHVDEGEFATKAHHTHACQSCGMVWRPARENTVGVRFLPGYRSEPATALPAEPAESAVSAALDKAERELFSSLKAECDALRKERDETFAREVALQKEFDDVYESRRKFVSENSSLGDQVTAAIAERERQRLMVEDLTAERDSLKNEISALERERFERPVIQRAQDQARIRELEAAAIDLRVEIKNLESRYEGKVGECEQLKKQLRESGLTEISNKVLSDQLVAREANEKKLLAERVNLKKDLNEATEHVASGDAAYRDLARECDRVNDRVQKLDERIRKLDERVQKLGAERDDWKKNARDNAAERTEWRNRARQLEGEIAGATKALDEARFNAYYPQSMDPDRQKPLHVRVKNLAEVYAQFRDEVVRLMREIEYWKDTEHWRGKVAPAESKPVAETTAVPEVATTDLVAHKFRVSLASFAVGYNPATPSLLIDDETVYECGLGSSTCRNCGLTISGHSCDDREYRCRVRTAEAEALVHAERMRRADLALSLGTKLADVPDTTAHTFHVKRANLDSGEFDASNDAVDVLLVDGETVFTGNPRSISNSICVHCGDTPDRHNGGKEYRCRPRSPETEALVLAEKHRRARGLNMEGAQ